jgi:hypothetical protein
MHKPILTLGFLLLCAAARAETLTLTAPPNFVLTGKFYVKSELNILSVEVMPQAGALGSARALEDLVLIKEDVAKRLLGQAGVRTLEGQGALGVLVKRLQNGVIPVEYRFRLEEGSALLNIEYLLNKRLELGAFSQNSSSSTNSQNLQSPLGFIALSAQAWTGETLEAGKILQQNMVLDLNPILTHTTLSNPVTDNTLVASRVEEQGRILNRFEGALEWRWLGQDAAGVHTFEGLFEKQTQKLNFDTVYFTLLGDVQNPGAKTTSTIGKNGLPRSATLASSWQGQVQIDLKDPQLPVALEVKFALEQRYVMDLK